MSDETLVPPVVEPTVEPVVVPEVPITEPVVVPEVPVVEPVVGEVIPTAPIDSTPAEPVVVMYNGQQVKYRQGTFDADGAELCELADGSTAFVPKSVLGA